MCSRLIDIHNITLWSCPHGAVPMIETAVSPTPIPRPPATSAPVPSPYFPTNSPSPPPANSPSPSPASSLPPANSPSPSPIPIPSPSPAIIPSHYSPTWSPSASIRIQTPSPTFISSPSPPKALSSRLNSSTNRDTRPGNTTCLQQCDCNTDILHILHVLWVLPLLFLIGVFVGRKIVTYKIQGMPTIRYFMTRRSQSWPRLETVELSNRSNTAERSRSEPTSRSEAIFDSIVV
jgi:hypothetical protein